MIERFKDTVHDQYKAVSGMIRRYRKSHSGWFDLFSIVGLVLLAIVGFVLAIALFFGLIFLLFLPFYFIAWEIWIHLLPAIWPTGDKAITEPGFWTFAGCCYLISFVKGLLFGGIFSNTTNVTKKEE